MGGKRRSLKGHVAHISTAYLRLLNWITVAGALATIVIVFVIKHGPIFPYGWGFIGLGVVTVIAGLFGAISSGQMGCFGCHMVCMVGATLGLCVSSILIFARLNNVLEAVEYDLSWIKAEQLMRILGAIYFILFCIQLVIFMLACLIYSCGFIDYYEDLEALRPQKQLDDELETEKKQAKSEEESSLRDNDNLKEKYDASNGESGYSPSQV